MSLLDKYPTHVEGKGCSISFRPKYIFITSNYAPNEWYGRTAEKKFHSTHGEPGTTVVVEKVFDSSALMRRLEKPMGIIDFMDKKFVPSATSSNDIDATYALINKPKEQQKLQPLIDLCDDDLEEPVSPLPNPYETYGDIDDDDNQYNNDDDDEIIASSNLSTLKRTDTMTFRTPETPRGIFKKLGQGHVQSKLAFAQHIKRPRDDDFDSDDDVDDKVQNSQKK